MKNTVKTMLESDFGFATSTYSANKVAFENTQTLAESTVNMMNQTPDRVIVLKDNDKYYIEFANNLDRLMVDQKLDFKEAVEEVALSNKIAACDINIIIDESSIDRIDLESLFEEVGKEHVFRK